MNAQTKQIAEMKKTIILIPVYNDWVSLTELLTRINNICAKVNIQISVVIVDDGSTEERGRWNQPVGGTLKNIKIIHLARNLGHQKAIAIGLSYISTHHPNNQVIIMDCDGEDKPEDIPHLLKVSEISPNCIIFAHRTHRSEGLIFRLFYNLYKLFFRTLTGVKITFGNFSLIPSGIMARVVYLPEIWNHYAAGIIHARVPWQTIPSSRGKRYFGKSKMNLISLILHGLSSMSVFIEVMAARIFIFCFLILALVVVAFMLIVYFRYFTELAIPGWATNVVLGLMILTLQTMTFLALLSFVVLSYRTNKIIIPIKDYEDYIFEIEKV